VQFAPREQLLRAPQDKISHALMWSNFEQARPKFERMILRCAVFRFVGRERHELYGSSAY
jgi:hypothetical protein